MGKYAGLLSYVTLPKWFLFMVLQKWKLCACGIFHLNRSQPAETGDTYGDNDIFKE